MLLDKSMVHSWCSSGIRKDVVEKIPKMAAVLISRCHTRRDWLGLFSLKRKLHGNLIKVYKTIKGLDKVKRGLFSPSPRIWVLQATHWNWQNSGFQKKKVLFYPPCMLQGSNPSPASFGNSPATPLMGKNWKINTKRQTSGALTVLI